MAGLNLLRPSSRGGQLSVLSNIEVIARAIAQGYTFGPRARCACCHQKNGNPDEIDRGLCERCWEAARNTTEGTTC